MEDSRVIELKDFGGEGCVEVGSPTLSMKVKLKNELGKRAKIRVVDGQQIMEYSDIGDVEILKTLSFIRSAPFPLTLRGFLDYCDELDKKSVGNAERLFEAISLAAEEVATSPGPLGN